MGGRLRYWAAGMALAGENHQAPAEADVVSTRPWVLVVGFWVLHYTQRLEADERPNDAAAPVEPIGSLMDID